MGLREAVDAYFGTRVRRERELRGWSQEELAKRLRDKGILVYASTIAKIEAERKPRAARLGEAAGMADLFGVSLDLLLGRTPGAQRGELTYALRGFRNTAQRSRAQVGEVMETIRQQLDELPSDYDGAKRLREGSSMLDDNLFRASEGLKLMALIAEQSLLDIEEGAPEDTEDEAQS